MTLATKLILIAALVLSIFIPIRYITCSEKKIKDVINAALAFMFFLTLEPSL